MLIQQIEPKNAFIQLRDDKKSILIDVRTDAELTFVGQVDVNAINCNFAAVAWKSFPAMNLNPRFSLNLEKILQEKFGPDLNHAKEEVQLIFMCRSGARSSEAAMHMANLGYKHCFNMIGGFEGNSDDAGHRGNIDGWKANNLPWRQ